MMKERSTGTMTLPSRTAIALWEGELTGQMSDGMWENSGPRDHWKFWCRMDVVEGAVAGIVSVPTGYENRCRKNRYGFASLIPHVGDRMLNMGRMARASQKIGAPAPTDEQLRAAEYMPLTMFAFCEGMATKTWEHDFIAKYMENVSFKLAAAFYESTYTMSEMKKDIKLIKDTMKNVAV